MPGHDRVMTVLRTEKFQEPIQLTDAHPVNQIYMLREGWIGLAGERHRDDLVNASLSR